MKAVEFATLEWVDWFNHRRLLEPIRNIPPTEAEALYFDSLETPAMATYLNQTASGKPGPVQSAITGALGRGDLKHRI